MYRPGLCGVNDLWTEFEHGRSRSCYIVPTGKKYIIVPPKKDSKWESWRYEITITHKILETVFHLFFWGGCYTHTYIYICIYLICIYVMYDYSTPLISHSWFCKGMAQSGRHGLRRLRLRRLRPRDPCGRWLCTMDRVTGNPVA